MKKELLLPNDKLEDDNGTARIILELCCLIFVLMFQDTNKFLNFSQTLNCKVVNNWKM